MSQTRKPSVGIWASVILLVSCASPGMRLERARANADLLPRSWLKSSTTQATASAKLSATSREWFNQKWSDFLSKMNPGDELWYWNNSSGAVGHFTGGYCIVRGNQIVAMIETEIGEYLDQPSA